MKKPKLNIPDQRMLQLPGILKAAGFIRYKREFLETIQMPRQNFSAIERTGHQHFTATQIHTACITYSVNANWIFGLPGGEKTFQSIHTNLPKRKSLRKMSPVRI